MVQAARSGVQNIAEGSQASATSKKFELKLTSVARASLEELKLDYEDYLRQRNLPMLPPDGPALMRFKQLRCATLEEVQRWISAECARWKDEHGQAKTNTDSSLKVSVHPCPSSATLAANATLSPLNLACYLFDRQISALANAFETEGGFTERLYRIRSQRRKR